MRSPTRLAVVLLAFLGGCSSMSKNECLVADWNSIGFEDGAAGRNAAYIGERRKACAKAGVAPDSKAYSAGYNKGILTFCNFARGRSAALSGSAPYEVCPSQSEYQKGFADGINNFCTYESGYDYGFAGGTYQRTCPATMEDDFLQGFNMGANIRSLENQLSSLQNQINDLQNRRDDNKHHQQELKQQLILGKDLNSEQRAQILLDLDKLHDESDDLKKQKKDLLRQVNEVNAQLRKLGISN